VKDKSVLNYLVRFICGICWQILETLPVLLV